MSPQYTELLYIYRVNNETGIGSILKAFKLSHNQTAPYLFITYVLECVFFFAFSFSIYGLSERPFSFANFMIIS